MKPGEAIIPGKRDDLTTTGIASPVDEGKLMNARSVRSAACVELEQNGSPDAKTLIGEMEKTIMSRPQDIDYAAAAVKKAILEKFNDVDLESLQVMAGERTIYLEHDGRSAEGARGILLADIRKAASYDDLWKILANNEKIIG